MWWGRKLLRVSVYLGDGSLVPLISVAMPRCGVCGGDENCSGSRYIWEMVPLSRLYLYLCLGVEYVVGTETAPGLGIPGRRFPCPAAQPPVGLGQGW